MARDAGASPTPPSPLRRLSTRAWIALGGLALAIAGVVVFVLLRGDGLLHATVTFDTSRAQSATIGTDGGSIEAIGAGGERYRLTIPEGALEGPFVITVTPIATIAGTPMDDGFLGGVGFEPDGLAFLKSAELEVTTPQPYPADAFGFSFAEAGRDVHRMATTFEGETARASFWHFSGWGAGQGTPAQNALQAYQPSDGEQAAYRSIQNAFADALKCAQLGGDDCAPPDAAQAFLDGWDYIKAALEDAKSDPHRDTFVFSGSTAMPNAQPAAKLAMAKALEWLADVDLSGITLDDYPELDSATTDAWSLIGDVAKAAADKAYVKCTGTVPGGQENVPVAGTTQSALAVAISLQLDYVLYWAQQPLLLGLDEDYDPAYQERVEACVTPVIVDVSLPHLDKGGSGTGTYLAGVQFNGSSGALRQDLAAHGLPPTLLRVEADGGTAAVITATTPPENPDTPLTPDVQGKLELLVSRETDDAMTLTATASWKWGDFQVVSAPRTDVVLAKTRVELTAKAEGGSSSYGQTASIDPGQKAKIRAVGYVDDEPARNRAITYEIEGDGSLTPPTGLTDNDGLLLVEYSAPNEPATVRITAIMETDTGSQVKNTATILVGDVLSLSPDAAAVTPGVSLEFSITEAGFDPALVTWSTTGGTISGSGLSATWTAPSSPGTYTVRAQVQNGPLASAQVTVLPGGGGGSSAPGTFSEGFYYGRLMHECEWNPDYGLDAGTTCADQVAELSDPTAGSWTAGYAAWLHIHEQDGRMVMDFYHEGNHAVGWVDPQNGWRTAFGQEDWRYRAWWAWTERTLSSVGATSTVAQLPDAFRPPPGVLCYLECLSSPSLDRVPFQWEQMRLEFGDDGATLIGGGSARWTFVKDAERDPFGVWAFNQSALETPQDCRVDDGGGRRACG